MKNPLLLFSILILASCGIQKSSEIENTTTTNGKCIMFYNVENLFDSFDDSLTRDEDFTPEGYYHWTYNRYQEKLNKIYKVIISTAGWDPPAIIGLCEIENYYVLHDLCHKTPLEKFDYSIAHFNSPDARGIDVGLLHTRDFRILSKRNISVSIPQQHFLSRDILHVFGVLSNKDSLHIFVNHWPSRRGGAETSAWKRAHAATILKHQCDSIFSSSAKANIIIMGDFNDEPNDESIVNNLQALSPNNNLKTNALYNLANNSLNFEGSHKYKEHWGQLDQIIVSGNILATGKTQNKLSINHQGFLLLEDETNLGLKPYRTYQGPKYLGGYSDHLPVYIFYSLN